MSRHREKDETSMLAYFLINVSLCGARFSDLLHFFHLTFQVRTEKDQEAKELQRLRDLHTEHEEKLASENEAKRTAKKGE